MISAPAHMQAQVPTGLEQPASTQAATTVTEWRRLARQKQESGDHAVELSLWLSLLTVDPADIEANERSATILQGLGRHADALGHFRVLANTNPGNAKAWKRLARGLQATNDSAGALLAWNQVLAIANDLEAHDCCANLLEALGRKAEAVVHLRTLADAAPDKLKPAKRLARALIASGDPAGSLTSWQRVLTIAPDDLEAHERCMELLQTLGRKEESVAHIRAMIDSSPAHVKQWKRLARVLGETGDMVGAVSAWEKVLALSNTDVEAHSRLTELLEGLGRGIDAIPHLRAVAEATPDNAKAWKRLAHAIAKSGDSPSAAAAWRQALSIAPDDIEARSEFARSSARLANAGKNRHREQPSSTVYYLIRSKAHFSYHQSTVDALIRKGANVRLYFDEFWTNYGEPSHVAFEEWHQINSDIKVGYYPTRTDFLRDWLMFFRELRSYNNYCRRGDHFKFYSERWAHYLKLKPKTREWVISQKGRRLVGLPIVRLMTAAIEQLAPPATNIRNWLSAKRPSVVVASPANMRFSEEIEVLKAAKSLGISTVVPVLSWDNMSTKGLIHIHPTRLLAWNEAHREEAIKYHRIDARTIRVTGAPFFDKWHSFSKQSIVDRETLSLRVGLDSKRPYILYLGSSANIARDETWFVLELRAALALNPDPLVQDLQILFRPHPANWKIGIPLLDQGIAMWPREGTLPDSEVTFADFRDCLEHAACVVGINTSGMVDALAYGKAVISPLLEKYQLTQDNTHHFDRMRQSKAIYLTGGAIETASCIAELLNGRDHLASNRQEFTKNFIFPMEIKGGEAQAEEIIALMTPSEQETCKLVSEIRAIKRPGELERRRLEVAQKKQISPPKRMVDTDLQNIFSSFKENVEKVRISPLYTFYLEARDTILRLINSSEYKLSSYWFEEVQGFDYLLDASPLLVSKIREHCYHITGERSYLYRQHHAHKAQPVLDRLKALQAQDKSNLFVPESPMLGGFGYDSPRGLVNIDTLKFYEVMLGLDRSGFLDPFKQDRAARRVVLEIGSGWGGFIYQFKTLFPNNTFFLIDLPATLLFAAIYLRGVFPDARLAILEAHNANEVFERWESYDIVFGSAHDLPHFKPGRLDLAINMVSFQEMTTEQVRGYIHHLASLNCTHLYSMNRDRSQHNSELSLVSGIMQERYELTRVAPLETEYTAMGTASKKAPAESSATYRHYAGRLRTTR